MNAFNYFRWSHHTRLTALLVVLSSLGCSQVYAVGVSDITLHSKLGEPLEASIQITDSQDLDKEQLIVRIPSQQAFKQLGVERKYEVLSMKFQVQDNHRVTITTHDPIKEPYLHFIIEVLWPEGQLYREYKVFLDPV